MIIPQRLLVEGPESVLANSWCIIESDANGRRHFAIVPRGGEDLSSQKGNVG